MQLNIPELDFTRASDEEVETYAKGISAIIWELKAVSNTAYCEVSRRWYLRNYPEGQPEVKTRQKRVVEREEEPSFRDYMDR